MLKAYAWVLFIFFNYIYFDFSFITQYLSNYTTNTSKNGSVTRIVYIYRFLGDIWKWIWSAIYFLLNEIRNYCDRTLSMVLFLYNLFYTKQYVAFFYMRSLICVRCHIQNVFVSFFKSIFRSWIFETILRQLLTIGKFLFLLKVTSSCKYYVLIKKKFDMFMLID